MSILCVLNNIFKAQCNHFVCVFMYMQILKLNSSSDLCCIFSLMLDILADSLSRVKLSYSLYS